MHWDVSKWEEGLCEWGVVMDGAVELDGWGREMHWEVDELEEMLDEWGVVMGGVGELDSSCRRVPDSSCRRVLWELGSWGIIRCKHTWNNMCNRAQLC